MLSNDVLTVRFRPRDDGCDIAWDRVNRVVGALHGLVGEAIARVVVLDDRGRFELILSGAPTRGSLDVRFKLEIAANIQMKAPVLAAVERNGLEIGASVATIAAFVLQVVVVTTAQSTGSFDPGQLESNDERAAAELASAVAPTVGPRIKALREAAEATGCVSVELSIRGIGPVELVPQQRSTAAVLPRPLGQAEPPAPKSTIVAVSDGDAVVATYRGALFDAVLAKPVKGGGGSYLALLPASRHAVAPSGTIGLLIHEEIDGAYVAFPQGMPSAFEGATRVVLATRAAL